MSIEDWARREAKISYPEKKKGYMVSPLRRAFREGAVHAFSALLSDDKAARAAVRQLTEFGCNSPAKFRAALQAAVDAVSKGDTE